MTNTFTSASFTDQWIRLSEKIFEDAAAYCTSEKASQNSEVVFPSKEGGYEAVPSYVAEAYLDSLGKIVDDRVMDVRDACRDAVEDNHSHASLHIAMKVSEEICSNVLWNDVPSVTLDKVKKKHDLTEAQEKSVLSFACACSWRAASELTARIKFMLDNSTESITA